MAVQGGSCETCGVMGWDQYILTCEKCGARNHQYCTAEMFFLEAPDYWSCQECRCHLNIKGIISMPNQQKDSPGAKNIQDHKRGKDTARSLNIAKKKKVMYLPLEDVLKMPLAEREGAQFQTRRKHIPLTSQSNKAKSRMQSKDPVRWPNQNVTAEKPLKIMPTVIDEISTIRKGESCNLYKTAINKADIEKKDAVALAAEIYCPRFPARVTWMGRFKFPEDSAADGFGDLVFFAVSPGSVSHNALECSLNLPSELLVELIPLRQLPANLFPNFVPDLRDIGIYFAIEEASERSFQTYNNLVEGLLSKDFALRCCFDGAELFIFTSKLLNSDSQLLVTSGLKNKWFLWGVFCSTRSRVDKNSSEKGLLSESTLHKDDHENRVCPVISSTEPVGEGHGLSSSTATSSGWSPKKALFSESALHKYENGNGVCLHIPSTEPVFEGCGVPTTTAKSTSQDHPQKAELCGKETVATSLAPPAGMEIESCRIPEVSIKNVKVEVPAMSPTILEPRPKLPPDISEQPAAHLKNWVTLNTSSAVRSDRGTAGAGGIICTSSGKWEHGFVMNLGKCDRLKADLWSLFQGLISLWKLGYQAVTVRSDSAAALSLLKKAPSPEDPNGDLIIGCRDILVRDWKCIQLHIKVEDNAAAHRLADRFESYDLGPTFLETPPPELSCLFKG